ncbi:MAG: hypothetical protein JO323_12205, partial [Acidobacteriia bacterium]|nr:hypothetical protein [Terriglobia bacterium]
MRRLAGIALSSCWLAGCAGVQQSAVDAAGPGAGKIQWLFWFFLYLLGAIFVAVIALTVGALARRPRDTDQESLQRFHLPAGATEKRVTRNVAVATGGTVVILLGLLVASVSTGKGLSHLGGQNPLSVQVVGNQWWWYVSYPNVDPSR